MRTTLTLDDDVAVALEHLRSERDGSFKDIVNDTLRAGIRLLEEGPQSETPRRTRSFHVGQPYLANVDNVAEVLAYAEGENFK